MITAPEASSAKPCMWKKPKTVDAPVSPSKKSTSGAAPDPEAAQLSDPDGVNSEVSRLSLDRGLLSAGVHPPQGAATGANGLSYAEMMLRVKAGDDSALDLLVQAD